MENDISAKIDYKEGKPPTLHLRKCKLVLEEADGKLFEYIFDQDSISIGSDEDNDLVLPYTTVSRYHCKIIQEPVDYILCDLDSTNGTFINKIKIREAYLKNGCNIQLGDILLKFQVFGEEYEVQPSLKDSFGNIVGRSIKMREVFAILEKIAPTCATIIIEGETGTGKEVVARTIHEKSSRAKEPFIVFDCGAVPKDIIESELFGHEKGSFTGAITTRPGLFEIANGGTLFLDEIGELYLDLQPKLLRALEQREIRKVGSNRSIKVDVRLIAATNKNLEEEVKTQRFREDLYYRLSVVRIYLPPLRERKEDIPLLIKHFLRTSPFNKTPDGEQRIMGINEEALESLMNYHWPGNVRELMNVIERACSFCDGDVLQIEDLPPHFLKTSQSSIKRVSDEDTERIHSPFKFTGSFKEQKEEIVEKFEKEYIINLLKRCKFKLSLAAKEASLDRKYLRKLIKKHNINIEELKE